MQKQSFLFFTDHRMKRNFIFLLLNHPILNFILIKAATNNQVHNIETQKNTKQCVLCQLISGQF